MAITHIVGCDGPGCDEQQEVGPPPAPMTNWLPAPMFWSEAPRCPVGQRMPEGWVKAEGQDFHSWGCVANYSGQLQEREP